MIRALALLLFLQSPPVVTPPPVSYNAQWAGFAQSCAEPLGIKVGSTEWEAGGMPGYTGTTGYHVAEGWDHTGKGELLDAAATPAQKLANYRLILSNYAARPDKYLSAPFRYDDYEHGGRPSLPAWAWQPGLDALSIGGALYSVAHPSGGEQYPGGIVYGPDGMHFLTDPLLGLVEYGDASIILPAPKWGADALPDLAATSYARVLSWFIAEHAVGVVRPGSYAFNAYTYDRQTARILDTLQRAFKLGILDPSQSQDALAWVTRVLSQGLKGPGVALIQKWNDLSPPLEVQTPPSSTWPYPIPFPYFMPVHELGYLTPPMYWMKAPGLEAARDANVRRRCQWAVDIVGPNGEVPWYCQLHNGETLTKPDGSPVDTVAPLLANGRLTNHYFVYSSGISYYGPTAAAMFTTLKIASEVYNIPGAKEKAAAVFQHTFIDPQNQVFNRRWLVGIDRHPVIAP